MMQPGRRRIAARIARRSLCNRADSGWTVLEVNGAVDFTAAYSLGDEIFSAVVTALLSRPRLGLVAAPA